MNMDDFPDEKPGIAWTVYLVAIVGLIAISLMALLYLSPKAHAQGLLCAQGDVMIRQTIEVKKQLPVWEGIIPVEGKAPAEVVLTQSEDGNWSMFILGDGKACLLFVGDSANPPIPTGKGV